MATSARPDGGITYISRRFARGLFDYTSAALGILEKAIAAIEQYAPAAGTFTDLDKELSKWKGLHLDLISRIYNFKEAIDEYMAATVPINWTNNRIMDNGAALAA